MLPKDWSKVRIILPTPILIQEGSVRDLKTFRVFEATKEVERALTKAIRAALEPKP